MRIAKCSAGSRSADSTGRAAHRARGGVRQGTGHGGRVGRMRRLLSVQQNFGNVPSHLMLGTNRRAAPGVSIARQPMRSTVSARDQAKIPGGRDCGRPLGLPGRVTSKAWPSKAGGAWTIAWTAAAGVSLPDALHSRYVTFVVRIDDRLRHGRFSC
jgi:hypothetical protein